MSLTRRYTIAPDTVYGELVRARKEGDRPACLPPDPVFLQLPGGSVRECTIRTNIWGTDPEMGGGIELRLDSEGASSLGLGANVTVYAPEVRWRAADDTYPIRPAHISHSTNGGEDVGDTEASIYLLTIAKELRDQLNAEAEKALGPAIAELEREYEEHRQKREALARRHEAIAARLRPYFGGLVRVTRKDGSRVAGTLLEKHRTIAVQAPSGKERTVAVDDLLLFEVKEGARFRPFELESKEASA